MKKISYNYAKNNLKMLINRVVKYNDEIKINIEDKSAILISFNEYQAMKETLYLIASKENKKRLDEAVEQIENSKFRIKSFINH